MLLRIPFKKSENRDSNPGENEKPCCSEAEADPSAQRYQSGRIQIISTGSREGQVSRNVHFHSATFSSVDSFMNYRVPAKNILSTIPPGPWRAAHPTHRLSPFVTFPYVYRNQPSRENITYLLISCDSSCGDSLL